MAFESGQCECGAQVERELPSLGWIANTLRRMPFVCAECIDAADREREREEAQATSERRAKAHRARQAKCGIPDRLRDIAFERLRSNPPPAEPLAAAEAWGRGEIDGLLLAGPVGVGKTWMAAAAAWQRLELGRLRWISMPRLFTLLDAGFDSARRADALETLVEFDGALVLDDLDKARPTEYAAEKLQATVTACVEDGRPLLVTMNRTLHEVAKRYPEPTGEALASRLVEHCEAYRVEGVDRRMRRAA